MPMRRKTRQRPPKKRSARRPASGPPIPLTPVDLLAGLGPDVELVADDLPPGVATESPSNEPTPSFTSIGVSGKLIRSGDDTIRRLIRTSGVWSDDADEPTAPARREPERAGVVRRTPDKPGE
jgi:hypothetical protein